ncbi:MAG: hypothetical protein M1827_002623 [Pycnora praestabilis]|nr:MAG: hypothetical protein M1827_002623 [Pycnora praestabilis]
MPPNGGSPRRHSNLPAPLPPSVERSYRQKCIELRRRMNEVEESNDAYRLRKVRLNRGIMKMRLERAFLLEQLARRTRENVDDSDGSASPPPTPKDKPLRTKRGHRKPSLPLSPSNPLENNPPTHASPSGALLSPRSPSHFAQQTATPPPPPHLLPKPPNTSLTHTSRTPGSIKPPLGPSAPRRPKNAYMIFCDSARDKIRADHFGDPEFDMHKALAQAWRDLGTEGQRPFRDVYDERKDVYGEEMEEYRRRFGGGAAAGGAVALGGEGMEFGLHGAHGLSGDGNGFGEEANGGVGDGGEIGGRGEDVEMEDGGADGASGGDGGGFTAVNR